MTSSLSPRPRGRRKVDLAGARQPEKQAALRVAFKVAQRWRLVRANPALLVEPLRVSTPEMNILSEAEIARLATAYLELEQEADAQKRPWWRLARRLTTLALATALRRGKLPGLRWPAVKMLEGLLTVEQAFVRGEFTTPKSKASRRTLELGPRALAVLEEQFADNAYRALRISSSGMRRSGRRSIRRSSPATTCARR